MWDLIITLSVVLLILYLQSDVLQMYYALTTYEEVSKRQNYGKIQFYPEVKDFFCPTCNRHFSSYDHCHRHAEIRNHNISSLFCKYSYKGLPKCRRSSPQLEEDHLFGSCCFPGRKPTMEDIHWASPYDIDIQENQQQPVIYGICDGHRGTNAAQYLASQIEQFLITRRHDRLPSAVDVRDAFKQARDSYLQNYCYSGDISGSTSTIVIKDEGELIIANIGDSSGFVCCDEFGRPFSVTFDHRVSNDIEKKRILAIGGKIKDERLFGQLALSRSFGDCLYSSFLSVEPHIDTFRLNSKYHQYLVLATDGVWDYISISEVNGIVQSIIQKEVFLLRSKQGRRRLLDRAAMMISYEAYVKGSTDNICTMVISLLDND